MKSKDENFGLRFVVKIKKNNVLEACFTDVNKKIVYLDDFQKDFAASVLNQIKMFVNEITLENINMFDDNQ